MTPAILNTLTQHIVTQLPQTPNQVRRLFHGRGRCFEGLEQITVDFMAGQLFVSLFKEMTSTDEQCLIAELTSWTQHEVWPSSNVKAILMQYRYLPNHPTQAIWGEGEKDLIVDEEGLTFQLSLGRNQNVGLFLDMRYGRRWVTENSQNKRVLNLFAYTCGFSVAAMKGQADLVINLDMAKGALSRGRDNHRLNDHDLNKVNFFAHDIFKSWGKIKKYAPYDLIIIDPPSFQKGSFALTTDYQKILRRLPDLLNEKGQVLACINDPNLPAQFLIDSMQTEAPELDFQYRLENPPEFPDIDVESGLKALIFSKNT
ncbi:class I SAM-dependent methyltransferase [Marinomonas sp. TW1]|uniref:class I SAM-dependent methyltransferase n=1 Tax=Marinomonas sp. TW1 TaxID=1561203 RepID=UPI0007AFD475|nr:class I SAM-dependent methyltransferase [Marinomonas sp. TW1]KZN13298.1 methyltransferase [Marinomonas sp. TW1]